MAKKACFLGIFAGLLCSGLWAGGWNNTLIGCRAISMGGAFSAIADDPSAIFYNPAGLVYQQARFNFSIDSFHIWPTHEYTLPAGRKIQSKFDNTIPQIFFSYRTSEKVTLGFGVYVPYAGGGVDWKKEQLGFPLKSTLGVVSFTPTVSYQINEKVAVGLNINFYRSQFTLDTEMDPFGPVTAEESGSAVSAGLGIMLKPLERLTIGLSARGPATFKLTGLTKLTYDIYRFSLDSDTSFKLPWDFELGIAYRASENLVFSADAQYTLWSVLDKVEKVIHRVPVVGELRFDEAMNFTNITILRAGGEYSLLHGVFFRAGIGLDRYATPEASLNASNIDVDKITFLGGIGYKTGKMRIDFAYAYGIGKEREKTIVEFASPVTEKYNLNVLILGVGVTFTL
jgi:long-chain fatty acid transport protein